MREDWTEQLRQQLDDYEQPAPEGLWDDIAAQLPPADGGRARIVALRRRFAAIAAAAAVAATVGVTALLYEPEPSSDQLSAISKDVPNASPAPPSTESPVPGIQEAEPVSGQKPSNLIAANQLRKQPEELPATATVAIVEPVADSEGENPPATEPEPTTPETTVKPSTAVTPPQTGQRHPVRPLPPVERRTKGQLTLSLHGSNLLAQGSATATEPIRMAPTYMTRTLYNAMFTDVGKSYDDDPLYLNNCSEESRHRAPLNVGLSLRLPLTQRLWIESGVSYSRVSSTLTSRMNQIRMTKDQLLHYIGMPLGAGYTLWQSRHATAYLSVGGTAYMCVAANQEADGKRYDISRDRVQFALSTHAGAEWRLLPPLSLYVEPGLCYYPDNGSALQNSFKEHPTQFDLRFGLRLTVK